MKQLQKKVFCTCCGSNYDVLVKIGEKNITVCLYDHESSNRLHDYEATALKTEFKEDSLVTFVKNIIHKYEIKKQKKTEAMIKDFESWKGII